MTIDEAAALVSGDNIVFANGDTAVVSRQGPGAEAITLNQPEIAGTPNYISPMPGIQPRAACTVVCTWAFLKDATKAPAGAKARTFLVSEGAPPIDRGTPPDV